MKRALLICDAGKVGTRKQAEVLALGLGCAITFQEVTSPFSWIWGRFLAEKIVTKRLCGFPWDYIISAGRRSAPVAVAMKKILSPHTPLFFHIMDPGWWYRDSFDALIIPTHDGLKGDNCISVPGALAMRVQPSKEVESAYKNHINPKLPTVVMLIGGNTSSYTFTAQTVSFWCACMSKQLAATPMNVLISFSRRTTPDIREKIICESQKWGAWVWDETPPNPYPFLLNVADIFLISQDSISMVSEAALMGKALYLLSLEGKKRKFDHFYHDIIDKGYAHWFAGDVRMVPFSKPLNSLQVVLDSLKARGMIA
ncbi:MAG: mitochondrial fission ELM1 family protein [Alphaproteobacteria bacterium]|nr:MAG: mitochondrial fission ELM1 family protein [Alphaproteobacteria bacterium]